MLELAILGLVKEQPLHGYELKKRLADTVGPGSGVSFGSLYPALGRLVTAGALRIVEPNPDPARRTDKTDKAGSRGRKVYSITERGEQLFEELLAADAGSGEDERAFTLRLAFARYLPADARIGMLERRRAFLLTRLARTRGAVRHGWDRLDAYTRSLMEHGNETTERDISWLDRLIARERAAGAQAATATATTAEVGAGGGAGAGADRGMGPAGDRAAVTASAWAASTAPTMPAPPARHRPPPAAPTPPIQPPAPPASHQPAPPASHQPAPPALSLGGINP